jgi:hypothetical protein
MLSFSFILTAGMLGIGFPAPPLRELLSEAVSEPVSMSISFRNLEATMCAYAAGAATATAVVQRANLYHELQVYTTRIR